MMILQLTVSQSETMNLLKKNNCMYCLAATNQHMHDYSKKDFPGTV